MNTPIPKHHAAAGFFLLAAFFCTPSLAVFEAEVPLPKIYATSKGVVVGVVEKVNAETGDVDVNAKEVLNGEGFDGACRIAVAIAEVRPRVAVGQPVVIVFSKRDPDHAILHVGNTWVLSDYDSTKRIPFFIARGLKADLSHTFPGATDTLITILRALKADGKSALIDKVDPKTFAGIKQIGKLPIANPIAVTAGDFDGDGLPEMAVKTGEGVQVFSLTAGAVAPSKTEPPKDFPAKYKLSDEGGPILASAIGAFGPAGERSAIVVRGKSITREPLDGNDKLPVDPLVRLTGDEMKVYFPGAADGIAAALATDIDINGDGKRDVLIVTEEAAVVLVNRGYGAFFVITRVKEILAKDGKYPFAIEPGSKLTSLSADGGKPEALVVVTADGTVFVAQ